MSVESRGETVDAKAMIGRTFVNPKNGRVVVLTKVIPMPFIEDTLVKFSVQDGTGTIGNMHLDGFEVLYVLA
jgi:hypothetical protein